MAFANIPVCILYSDIKSVCFLNKHCKVENMPVCVVCSAKTLIDLELGDKNIYILYIYIKPKFFNSLLQLIFVSL